MKLMLDFPELNAPFSIKHQHQLFFIGSCFAETMSVYFKERKFNTLENPFGVLYNPISIASSIKQITSQAKYDIKAFYKGEDLISSWDHHSKLSQTSAAALKENLEKINADSLAFLKATDVVFITLGTAWVSVLKVTKQVVANNHKASAALFDQKLLELHEITDALEAILSSLKEINPTVRLILSVSPVRHAKQGLVENNRSKARLLEGVHSVCAAHGDLFYVPSYEIILDALRDYRFYKADLIHPNEMATDMLWSYLEEQLIAQEAGEPMKKALDITTARKHKIMHPNTSSAKKFIEDQLKKIDVLEEKYPYLELKEEKEYFEKL